MCDIPADISKEELERRIAVFGDGHYGIILTVTLHGRVSATPRRRRQNKVDAPGLVPSEKAALA